MFHVELRMAMQYVREFNVDERQLWVQFLKPLMDDREFTFEGHDWEPRKTKLLIIEGPQLEPHELGMGRGWANALRRGTDVTEPALARARELYAQADQTARPTPAVAPAAATALRERLIGRLGAGPVSAQQIEEMAQALMPEGDPLERQAACEQAVWQLLAGGEAQISPSDR